MNLFNDIKGFTLTDFLILIILIISFKVLFFFTGFVLEDAFIAFRSAFNLVDYGKFSFNLDEVNSATTSKIFGLTCAFFKLIFKQYAVLFIVLFNSVLSFFSSFLILLCIKDLFKFKNRYFSKEDIFFLVILIFLNPSISLIGIVGLEFSVIVFFIALILLGVIKDNKIFLSFIIFIPLLRIELIGFVLILSFFYFLFSQWKNLIIIFIFGIFGILINMYLNYIFDGTLLPGTAISKWSTLGDSSNFSLIKIFKNLNYWFFNEKSFFLGVYSKFIPNFIYLVSGIFVVILAFKNFKYLIFNRFREINHNEKIFLMTISASIIFLPLSYIVVGHVWDWYLYPYSFLSYVLLTTYVINLKNYQKIKHIFILLVFIITTFQFFVLKNIGFQENSYRSVVGKDIYKFSENPKSDTLFLEPSGYIPYFAKIKTFDTVGLASTEILKFRNQTNNRWWLNFIEEKNPTFIVDRNNIFNGFSYDGTYNLSDSEIMWFKKNYKLIKEYNYIQFVNKYTGIFKPFYLLGSHSNYYLYKKIIY